jgi:hypothetical protein
MDYTDTRRNLHRTALNETLGNPISLHFSIITTVLALGLPQVANNSNPLTLGILAQGCLHEVGQAVFNINEPLVQGVGNLLHRITSSHKIGDFVPKNPNLAGVLKSRD